MTASRARLREIKIRKFVRSSSTRLDTSHSQRAPSRENRHRKSPGTHGLRGPRGVVGLRAMGAEGVESGERPKRQHHNLQLRDGLKNALENIVRETNQSVSEDRDHRMHPESRPLQGDEVDRPSKRESDPAEPSQKWTTATACSPERAPPESETTKSQK